MYFKFNGLIYGSEDEAKEAKKELIENGQALERDPIICVKLW
jgi:hypothetical protein